jgi:hypothetical protein
MSWCDALDYCKDLVLGGHADWRLPNVRELESIVDYGRLSPAANPVFRAEDARYWSCTTFVSSPRVVFTVDFSTLDSELISGEIKNFEFGLYVRAGRGGL